MSNELFKTLNFLSVKTLAYLVRDLSDSQENWQYYPENAPAETVRQELMQTLEVIIAIATERAIADSLDFAQLLQQVVQEQQQEEWAWQRDHQEQQNWTNDLD